MNENTSSFFWRIYGENIVCKLSAIKLRPWYTETWEIRATYVNTMQGCYDVNTMATDDLAPHVARSAAAIVLNTQVKRAFSEIGLHALEPFWGMKMQIYFMFPKMNPVRQELIWTTSVVGGLPPLSIHQSIAPSQLTILLSKIFHPDNKNPPNSTYTLTTLCVLLDTSKDSPMCVG